MFREQWKPMTVLMPKEMRTRIRKKARELGLNYSEFIRQIIEEKLK